MATSFLAAALCFTPFVRGAEQDAEGTKSAKNVAKDVVKDAAQDAKDAKEIERASGDYMISTDGPDLITGFWPDFDGGMYPDGAAGAFVADSPPIERTCPGWLRKYFPNIADTLYPYGDYTTVFTDKWGRRIVIDQGQVISQTKIVEDSFDPFGPGN